MSLNGQSYPFRRINQKRLLGHLGRGSLIQSIFFLYSLGDMMFILKNDMCNLTQPNISFITKLENQILDFSPELEDNDNLKIFEVIDGKYNMSENTTNEVGKEKQNENSCRMEK